MNLFANALLLSMMAAGGPGEAATPIKVNKACGAPSAVGSAEYFTGKVRIDAPFQADAPAQQIRPGDIVWIPPGVKHWHGSNANVAMTHIAIAESQGGTPVTWLEQVSEAQ